MFTTINFSTYQQKLMMDNGCLTNTTEFVGNYTGKHYIKPVGVYLNNGQQVIQAGYYTGGGTNNNQYWLRGSVFTRDARELNINGGSMSIVNFGDSLIPWFNNLDEASKYSLGQSFDNNAWIGGTDVRVLYNWQSVPSISGKNGILSLATLKEESINDGEPVSGAAVSVFDQAPSNDNNIKNLADTYGGGEASSAVDVTAKYKVTLPPGGSFSVLKLVAKKDSIPNDVSDGDKIVDISPSKTKKTVTGLDENSLYYFKIFAEDTNSNTSESDEKHISTGERPVVPSPEIIEIITRPLIDGYEEIVTINESE